MFSKMVQARSSVLYCGTTPMERRAMAGESDDVDAGDADACPRWAERGWCRC